MAVLTVTIKKIGNASELQQFCNTACRGRVFRLPGKDYYGRRNSKNKAKHINWRTEPEMGCRTNGDERKKR